MKEYKVKINQMTLYCSKHGLITKEQAQILFKATGIETPLDKLILFNKITGHALSIDDDAVNDWEATVTIEVEEKHTYKSIW